MTDQKFPNGTMQAMKLNGGGDGFGGLLKIPHLLPAKGQKIRLRPNSDKRKDTSPDYWVETPCYDASAQEWYWAASGAAWFKAPKAGGDPFFSINLDKADLPSNINLAAFKADDEDQPKKSDGGELFRFTYSRPRRAGSSANATQANEPVLQDDSIDF